MLKVGTFSSLRPCPDQPISTHSNPNLPASISYPFSLQSLCTRAPSSSFSCKVKSLSISCMYSRGRFESGSHHDHEDQYLEASLLVPETIAHYHLRKHGYQEAAKWQFSGQLIPPSAHMKNMWADVNSVGLGFLRRYESPTIFLKISCEVDFLLPIVVGEFAIEKLIDSLHEDDHAGCSNQFQFVRNLVSELGYEVKMVKITKRVGNTYFARVCFSKVGDNGSFSVDARPSDAINIARRFKAPIYVNKQIVSQDAIRIAYGTGRLRDTKPIYDVSLDSATEGPDLAAEELSLVKNLDSAVKEERYSDAAMWRDRLVKLRNSQLEH